jgi:hypothetical protein
VQSMPQYEQKTDSREFEIANPDQSPDATDLALRLWGPERSEPRACLSWKTDSVLVYMIADLVGASHGRIAEESPAIMGAHFKSSRQAIVAAKRIQTSMLEFLACRPGERIGAAILLYGPRTKTGESAGFSADTAQQALRQAKPGQILLAQNISDHQSDFPGVEFRTVPALSTVMGGRQTELKELVWTAPEKIALFQDSLGDEAEPQNGDAPLVGATVIVHSPFARRGPNSEGVPPAVDAPAPEELQESSGSSSELRLEEFGELPFLTRTRVILGAVVLVLVGALIAVLNHPVHVSKLPIPVQQEQVGATEVPDKQPPPKTEPDATQTQLESKTVKTEIAKPQIVKPPIIKSAAKPSVAAPPQMPDKASVDTRAKKDVPETTTPYSEESGGVSQKEIPTLLKMAQADAGAGNYDKARIEFRKIQGLQPGNQDAKEGLHKLDLIQKGRQ